MISSEITVAEYLLIRLKELGMDHLFGVPGDLVLGFLNQTRPLLHHTQFIGLFEGDRSRDYVRNRVESADCLLQLGALMTDFNTGGFTRVHRGGHSTFGATHGGEWE